MNLCARQILLTISYTSQFSYPLTVEEIWKRLFQSSSPMNFKKNQFVSELNNLVAQGYIETESDYYFLPGEKNTINQRKNNELATQKKRQEFQPVVRFARWLPWVVGVAITGSAAVDNAGEQDDTDVLLVTAQNRLWLVRPLFILFAYIYGKRRSWQKEEENSWCFNLWLEPSSLAQPRYTHSIYSAYEVCQADWVVSKNGCKELFFMANGWAKGYLPHYFEYSRRKSVPFGDGSLFGRLPVVAQVFDLLNYVLYWLQYQYMRSHMTRERVHLNQAFFHPRDTRKMITTNHQKLITRL